MHNNRVYGRAMNRIFIFLFGVVTLVAAVPACTTVDSDSQILSVKPEPTPPVGDGKAAANGAAERARNEATIEVREGDLKILGSRFDDLKDLPTPEIVFVFESERRELRSLSEDANKIVNEHWKEALRRFYDTEFNPPQSAKEQVERDRAWSSICSRTQRRLMETQIDAPGGRRKISHAEALETYGLINRLALAVTQDARKVHTTPSKI